MSDFKVNIERLPDCTKITVEYKGLQIEETGQFGRFLEHKVEAIKNTLIYKYNEKL